ncbi:MAG: heme ABC exporter ATP-binding protein CcmA [Deltaproteobacteria bacterium]|nr:heme ABC exporter ATP-binding protein CcmA [Deltaproteobacteria bacterium]
MAPPVIEAIRLGRGFGSVRALGALDLVVRAGDSLAIFGPNGAGKTTLLKLLATVLAPTDGTLRLFGEPELRPELRRRIGMLGHGSFLYGDLTAAENLRFYAALFGVENAERRVAEMLAEVRLTAWRDRPVRTFSRGMEQRLALARAFLHAPDLLLLDEPFSGLDPQAVLHLQEILTRAHRQGKTIVLTTHDIESGLEVCDRAVILCGGRMVWHSGRSVPAPSEMVKIYQREVGESHVGADSR